MFGGGEDGCIGVPLLCMRADASVCVPAAVRRHVRKAAVLSLSTLAHHKPRLLAGQLPPLLPKLYAQTAVDESLIRVVDLGPFKHRIDDGLELRKVGRGPNNAPLCCRRHPARIPARLACY